MDTLANSLDGNADGVGGDSFTYTGNSTNRFYVLRADWNGDGSVTVFDFPTFAYWFGVSTQLAPEYVDLNRDAGVSIFDLAAFAGMFSSSVQFPVARSTSRQLDSNRLGGQVVQEPVRAEMVFVDDWRFPRIKDRDEQADPWFWSDHVRRKQLERLDDALDDLLGLG